MTRRAQQLPQLAPGGSTGPPLLGLDGLADLVVRVEVPLGRVEVIVKELLELRVGTVLSLDRLTGEALDVVANGTPIAAGEVRVHGEKFAVRITRIRGVTPGNGGSPED